MRVAQLHSHNEVTISNNPPVFVSTRSFFFSPRISSRNPLWFNMIMPFICSNLYTHTHTHTHTYAQERPIFRLKNNEFNLRQTNSYYFPIQIIIRFLTTIRDHHIFRFVQHNFCVWTLLCTNCAAQLILITILIHTHTHTKFALSDLLAFSCYWLIANLARWQTVNFALKILLKCKHI